MFAYENCDSAKPDAIVKTLYLYEKAEIIVVYRKLYTTDQPAEVSITSTRNPLQHLHFLNESIFVCISWTSLILRCQIWYA